MRSVSGLAISSSVTMHGPSGPSVSDLASHRSRPKTVSPQRGRSPRRSLTPATSLVVRNELPLCVSTRQSGSDVTVVTCTLQRTFMAEPVPPVDTLAPAPVTFRDAFRFWVKLGFINFGGPAGQIAIMHRELVDHKRWVAEPLFLRALNFSMLLPGPEATELAIY